MDQENWLPELASGWSLDSQQEFTPTLGTLDSIQLWVTTPQQVPGVFRGGNTIVNIRDGVNVTIVAASKPTYAPPRFSGTIGFGFADPVNLIPGHVYVIEPVKLDGGPDGFGSTRGDRYPGGSLWTPTSVGGQLDLIFREGMGLDVVPEPCPMVLIMLGLSAAGCCYAQCRRSH